MKKFLSFSLVLCFVFCGFIFAGCGSNNIVLTGGPAYDDKIYGNGGYVVSKGDYVYFTDSYIKSSSLGSSSTININNITETGLYRAKMGFESIADIETPVLTDVELMVSKVVGFENSGLYIFKDKLYFSSPTTDSDKTGVRYDLLTFYSCNLDGSNLKKFYQTTAFSGGKFSMTMIDETVYLLIYTGSDVIRVSENGTITNLASQVTGAILPSRTTIVDNSENPISSDCSIYYTKDKEKVGSLSNGNILYQMDIKTGTIKELLNVDKISVSLKSLEAGRLFYTRNELIGSTSIYGYYSNSLDNENFLSSEFKHLNLNSNDLSINVLPLGEFESTNLGIAYLNSNKTLIIRNIQGTAGDSVETSVTSIICSRGGYLYYVASSSIYRINLTDSDASAEKISGTLTIKTDYFDVDEDFFYFFAEDKSKANSISIYRVDLASSDKTPVKMA